jgi:hypothetical protein
LSCGASHIALVHALGRTNGPLYCHDCGYTAGVAHLVETPPGRAKLAGVLFETCADEVRQGVDAAIREGRRIEELGALVTERGLAEQIGVAPIIVALREEIAGFLGRHGRHTEPAEHANQIRVVVRVANSIGSRMLDLPTDA